MFLTLQEARHKKKNIDWQEHEVYIPELNGIKIFNNYPVSELKDYIDWTPYFYGWGLKGRYPDIFHKDKYGKEAGRVFEEGSEMLEKIINEDLVKPKGIIGIYPANSSENDEILVYDNEEIKKAPIRKILMLRQQNVESEREAYLALSDYIAPVNSGKKDYIGFFAVTSGEEAEKEANKIKESGDPYNSLIFRFIVDRITEAFAERLHERVRKEFWGYAKDEELNNKELIREGYDGIRPAPGYPACPDHTLKNEIFSLLNVENNIGITLTKDLVMKPVSSIAGFYISHPESKYFKVGDITEEQLVDYANRKNISLKEAKRWLDSSISNNEKEYN